MPVDSWKGEERRQHDEACHHRLKECATEIKSWVQDQICKATKPTKAKQTLLLLLLGSTVALAGTAVVKSFAQNSEVKHNKEEIQEVRDAHKDLSDDVDTIKDAVGDMKIEQAVQGQILKDLARKFNVPVPSDP